MSLLWSFIVWIVWSIVFANTSSLPPGEPIADAVFLIGTSIIFAGGLAGLKETNMEFSKVIKEFNRICNIYCSGHNCAGCPLNERKGKYFFCTVFAKNSPKEFEEIVLKWSKEHPPITRLDKLNEFVKKTFGNQYELVLELETQTKSNGVELERVAIPVLRLKFENAYENLLEWMLKDCGDVE